MSRKKITTAKKEATVAKNKQRLDNLLNDTELSDVTLDFAYNRFMLRQYEKNTSPATRDFYERFFKKYFAFLEGMKLDRQASVDWLVVDGMMLGFISSLGDVKQQTINAYLRGYRAFGNYCEEQGLIVGFSCPIKEVALPPKPVYTDSELQRLTVKPPITDFEEFRDYTIIELLLATGARTNTILNIKIEDVNIEESTITFLVTKNGQPVILPLQKKARVALQEYIDYWRNVKDGDTEPSDYLFCNIYGEQLTRGGLSHAIANYNKRHGVEKTSIHLFRHTFAKNWITSGGDIISLAKILTHQELEMVKHYSNLYGTDLRDKIDQHSTLAQMRTRSGQTIGTRKKQELEDKGQG